MRINVKIDARHLKARTERQTKHLAYSVSDALNQTALAIQTAERVNLDRKFTIRQAGFMYRLIKIKPFASPRQGRPFVEILVDQKPRVLLGLFEQGGTKQPVKGASVAVPISGEAARPAFRDPVTAALRFTALHLRKRRGTTEREGAQRTFLIPGVGVFQRTARRATELIYAFVRAPRLKPRLDFVEIALRTFAREWPGRIKRAFEQ